MGCYISCSQARLFETHASKLLIAVEKARQAGRIHGEQISEERFASELRTILHTCVSGTLDVDRLDYLNRDSFYCGVPYGRCDIAMLVNNLELVVVHGRVALALREKAVHAFDDMLWSRYQLFIQVLNHKTNVALNQMLGDAIPAAIEASEVYGLKQPRDLSDFLAFTDDKVISAVFSAWLQKGRATDYARTLVRRETPLHVGVERMKTGSRQELRTLKNKKANELGWSQKKAEQSLLTVPAKSDLVKGEAFPYLIGWDKRNNRRQLLLLKDRSTVFSSKTLPRSYRVLHFFIPRGEQPTT